MTSEPHPRHVAAPAEAILDEVERAVVGKRDVLELVLLALLADGHVLLEDVPGVAKTLIARSFAAATGLRFGRVQFTPDLLPSDVTGSSVFDQRTASFEFRPGPVFCNLLLGDEINRAPPKTQAALLEAMEERQVTADDGTHQLERPFLVLATQNPIEYEGTYPLPEAQVDRFMIRVSLGYPSPHEEAGMLADHESGDRVATLEPELDILVWAVKAGSIAESSQRAQQIFDRCHFAHGVDAIDLLGSAAETSAAEEMGGVVARPVVIRRGGEPQGCQKDQTGCQIRSSFW